VLREIEKNLIIPIISMVVAHAIFFHLAVFAHIPEILFVKKSAMSVGRKTICL